MGRPELCVVFDLDDTLYLERDYVRSGFRAVGEWCAETLGVENVQALAQQLFDKGRRVDIFDAVLRQLGIAPNSNTITSMVRVYREHLPQISLLSDAVTCLDRLRGHARLALLTDGSPKSQWAKIEALGIKDIFESVVVTGEWGPEFSKPHVRGYRHLEAEFGPHETRFVYVADNPTKDFFAPRDLGWSAIRVKRPAGLYQERPCPSGLVRCEVSDLSSLPEMLAT